MTKVPKKIIGGGVLAAIGLSVLSPVQQVGVLLSVAGAAMWSVPALAMGKIKGKIKVMGDSGTVIRKHRHAERVIIAPTDPDGVVRLNGLELGEYEVNLIGNSAPVLITVGADGRMAFVAKSEITYPDPEATDLRARRALPVVHEWVEPVSELRGGGVFVALLAAAEMPDVNASTIEQLMRGTNNSRKAAASIIAEREKGGPFKDPLNFAQRLGSSVPVDFGYSSVRIGDTTIIARGGDPKAAGFKMVPGSGVVELYGKKHYYVGHVTLLK